MVSVVFIYCLINEDMVSKLARPPKMIILTSRVCILFLFSLLWKGFYGVIISVLFSTSFQAWHWSVFDSSFQEPLTCHHQTIITCSPDRRRYKEFLKQGSHLFYMPCWSLDEMKLVGSHTAKTHSYSIDAIEKRYD